MADNAMASPSGTPNFEACKLLLDEWKWRHQHCWTVLRQYGLAAVTVSIAPYLKPDLITSLGKAVLLFPALAWMLIMFATWLFAAEYIRCKAVETQYYVLLGDARPPDLGVMRWRNTVVNSQIGWTTLHLFAISGGVLCIINACFLNMLMYRAGVHWPVRWSDFWLVMISVIVIHALGLAVVDRKWRMSGLIQRGHTPDW
jgi:hypothetical protein